VCSFFYAFLLRRNVLQLTDNQRGGVDAEILEIAEVSARAEEFGVVGWGWQSGIFRIIFAEQK